MHVYVFTVTTGIADLQTLEVYDEPHKALNAFLNYIGAPDDALVEDYQHLIQENNGVFAAYERTDDDEIEVRTVEVK